MPERFCSTQKEFDSFTPRDYIPRQLMKNQLISFHYTLTNTGGETLDSSAGREPLDFVEGAGQIIPGLETHLVAMNIGDKKRVTIPAKDAYGVFDKERVFEIPRERIPATDMNVGDKFRMGNGQQVMVVTVTKLTDSHVTMDANHPLAGQDLTFDVELMAKREATPEDLAGGCGHEHGGGCCDGEEHDEHGGGCCGEHKCG